MDFHDVEAVGIGGGLRGEEGSGAGSGGRPSTGGAKGGGVSRRRGAVTELELDEAGGDVLMVGFIMEEE